MSTDGTYQKIEQAPRIISRDLSGRPTRGHPLYNGKMPTVADRIKWAPQSRDPNRLTVRRVPGAQSVVEDVAGRHCRALLIPVG